MIPFITFHYERQARARASSSVIANPSGGHVFGSHLVQHNGSGHSGSRFDEYQRSETVIPVFSGEPALSGHVLVLNNDYRALTVTSVQRATVLVLLQKADLVEANDRRFIRSASLKMPWPSIVRLRIYVRVPYKKIMLTRKNVMRRDGGYCQYCGSSDRLTIDHVTPKSRGGRDTWDNLVAACVPCNNTKGNKTPDEADMKLSRKPFRPSYVMYIRDFVGSMDDTWKPYLFLS